MHAISTCRRIGLTVALCLAQQSLGLAETAPTMTAAEAGEKFGLVRAAAEFCPAGVVTEKGKAFAAPYEAGPEAAVFKAEVDKIVEAWRQGTRCVEGEMDRMQLAMCRTMHLRNCRAVWAQMGPDGAVLPGLIDADYSQTEKKD